MFKDSTGSPPPAGSVRKGTLDLIASLLGASRARKGQRAPLSLEEKSKVCVASTPLEAEGFKNLAWAEGYDF